MKPTTALLSAALCLSLTACGLFAGSGDPAPASADAGAADTAGGQDATAIPTDEGPPPTDQGATGADVAPSDVGADDDGVDAPPPECTTANALFKCDDQDVCTKDSCDAGACVHAAIEGCCLADADCEDGITCTDDTCNPITHQCLQVFADNLCCLTAADCDDSDACTDDVCAANRCVHPKRPDAAECGCTSDLQCDDANPCTGGTCAAGVCAYPTAAEPACCDGDDACDDGDPATFDACQQSLCWNVAMPCAGDADCGAPTPCLAGACVAGTCAFEPLAAATACCVTEGECDDGVSDTVDSCVANRCVHSLGASAGCASDDDCAATACVASVCVVEAGQCSAAPTLAQGCCATAAGCPAPPDACTASTCEAFACGSAPLTGVQPFWESTWPAEDLGGWAVTAANQGVGWQRSTDQALSAPFSLYYGHATDKNYITSGANTGTATGPLVTAPAGATALTLTLWLSGDIEPLVSTDALEVRLVAEADGAVTTVWAKATDGIVVGWQELSLTITDAVTGPFRVQLFFDSIDDVNNDGEGVYVDDVRVSAPCDSAP